MPKKTMPPSEKSTETPTKIRTPSRRQGGRPTLAEAKALTDDILAVATQHFLEHGYHDTTFDRIAKDADTSKGALYLRYSDKITLFSAVCERLISQLYRADIVEPNQDLPMRACLEQQGRALLAAALNPVAISLYRMITNDAPNHSELSRSTSAVWDFYIDQMENYFRARIKLGRLALRDPKRASERFAELVFGSIHVSLVHGRPLPNPAEIERHVRESVLIFLGGIGRLEMESLEI